MIAGKVTGSIVSTRKCESLIGQKFMIVESMEDKKRLVAIDYVGAGIGEMVLVTVGSAARAVHGMEHSPVDAAIVGIIDEGNGLL